MMDMVLVSIVKKFVDIANTFAARVRNRYVVIAM